MKDTLHQMVRRFHQVAGIPVLTSPQVPDKERVKLRLQMIAEEFFELLAACEVWPMITLDDGTEVHAHQIIEDAIRDNLSGDVNLPEFADALTDMDYINEGTRLEFGIFGEAVLEEVHSANMRKFVKCATCEGTGQVEKRFATGPNDIYDYVDEMVNCDDCGGIGHLINRRPDGKILKPEGWTPPDIKRVLEKQGWKPAITSPAILTPKDGCTHGLAFDVEEARQLCIRVKEIMHNRHRLGQDLFTSEAEFNMRIGAESARTIRERFPRLDGECPLGCGYEGIAYVSTSHYVYGDW